MNNAELYEKNNDLQKRDAIECLEKYANKLHWKCDATVIDIGSGDGKVTTTVLKKYLPRCYKIIGSDKNENMVNFANKHYASDDTSFVVLDIEGDIPDHMCSKFQQAFSFYALHWPEDPEVVFTNIYDLLANKGECLLMFLGHLSFYEVIKGFARNSRWSPWITDVKKIVSPFHDCLDPEKEIKRIMYKIGFTNVEVHCKSKSYVYASREEKLECFRAVNATKIPEELCNEYLEEMMEEMCRIDRSNGDVDYSEAIKTFYYNLIYVLAKK